MLFLVYMDSWDYSPLHNPDSFRTALSWINKLHKTEFHLDIFLKKVVSKYFCFYFLPQKVCQFLNRFNFWHQKCVKIFTFEFFDTTFYTGKEKDTFKKIFGIYRAGASVPYVPTTNFKTNLTKRINKIPIPVFFDMLGTVLPVIMK